MHNLTDKKKMQHVVDQLRKAANEIEKELVKKNAMDTAPDPECIYCHGTGRRDCPAAKYDDEAYIPCSCYYTMLAPGVVAARDAE